MHSQRHDVVDAAAGATDIGRSEVEDFEVRIYNLLLTMTGGFSGAR